ncbi:MAG: tetratricopeptide repeat protein [Planctomycetaceae bacterium]|jgi:predicted O-linked N-acetylglucosamine transferase (SPINDLY family)|nr:tetratricopeptide repeat protein [Planctomycetaceae bacterium]
MVSIEMKKPSHSLLVTKSTPTIPSHVDNRYQNALTKHRAGDLAGAEYLYRQILSENLSHAGAWHFLGTIFHKQGRYEESLQYVEKSIRLENSKSIFYNNYGVILLEIGKTDEAISAFQKALELDPHYADARANLEQLRLNQNKTEGLKTTFESLPGLISSQSLLENLFQQGNQFFVQEQFYEANRAFHQAASLPGGQELWRWKSLGFCPTVMPNEESIIRYWQQLDHGLDLALQSNIAIDWRRLPFDGFTPSFNLPHHGNDCRSIKEKFAQIFTKGFPHDRPKLKTTMRNRTRIRIGFVTMAGHHRGFLRVYQSLLQKLNPDKFEIVFISPLSVQNSCRNLIGRNDIIWLGLNDRFDDSVIRIRDAQCDLIYHWKAGGCPFDYFLPFAKLAPIQCTSLGSHGTSGIPTIDYYLSSSFLETSELQKYYTERLIFLDSYPTGYVSEPTDSVTRQQLHLPEKGSLYFCPHRLAKYHPRFDLYLKQILERDQTGYLILLTGNHLQLAKVFSERIRQNLGEYLFRRVILFPLLSHEQYRKFYSVVTCVLDSPVYAGDLTAHDALEYNVPIVTQQGTLLVQRYTSGLYRMMNMEPFITDNEENYINLAVRIGTDTDYNATIRQTIAERKEAIFDTKSFIREYEHFFERVINLFDVSII